LTIKIIIQRALLRQEEFHKALREDAEETEQSEGRLLIFE
jgi:hypothetical protein